eukprot:1758198-Amphidinium_carterae.7
MSKDLSLRSTRSAEPARRQSLHDFNKSGMRQVAGTLANYTWQKPKPGEGRTKSRQGRTGTASATVQWGKPSQHSLLTLSDSVKIDSDSLGVGGVTWGSTSETSHMR